MTEYEMFEESFKRPKNFFNLDAEERCAIDKKLGILDWRGDHLKIADKKRFNDYYK